MNNREVFCVYDVVSTYTKYDEISITHLLVHGVFGFFFYKVFSRIFES